MQPFITPQINNWQFCNPYIVESIFCHLSLSTAAEASLTCKNWYSSIKLVIIQPVLNDIAKEFCGFFYPEILSSNSPQLMEKTLFQYISSIKDPKICDLVRAIIFSNKKMFQSLMPSFSQNFLRLSLPSPRKEFGYLNIAHLVFIFSNQHIIQSALADSTDPLVSAGFTSFAEIGSGYDQRYYTPLALALLAKNCYIVEYLFGKERERCLGDILEELGNYLLFMFCDKYAKFNVASSVSEKDRKEALISFFSLLRKVLSIDELNMIVIGSTEAEDIRYYSLLDWAVHECDSDLFLLKILLDLDDYSAEYSIRNYENVIEDVTKSSRYLYKSGLSMENYLLQVRDVNIFEKFIEGRVPCDKGEMLSVKLESGIIIEIHKAKRLFSNEALTLLRAINYALAHNVADLNKKVTVLVDHYKKKALKNPSKYPYADVVETLVEERLSLAAATFPVVLLQQAQTQTANSTAHTPMSREPSQETPPVPPQLMPQNITPPPTMAPEAKDPTSHQTLSALPTMQVRSQIQLQSRSLPHPQIFPLPSREKSPKNKSYEPPCKKRKKDLATISEGDVSSVAGGFVLQRGRSMLSTSGVLLNHPFSSSSTPASPYATGTCIFAPAAATVTIFPEGTEPMTTPRETTQQTTPSTIYSPRLFQSKQQPQHKDQSASAYTLAPAAVTSLRILGPWKIPGETTQQTNETRRASAACEVEEPAVAAAFLQNGMP